MASNTADAIANTPGSPPETTATRAPLGGELERVPRARELLAIVRDMTALPGRTIGNAREISVIADEIGRGGQRLDDGRRRQLGCARPQSDDGQ